MCETEAVRTGSIRRASLRKDFIVTQFHISLPTPPDGAESRPQRAKEPKTQE